jgi:hypothetical protein
MIFISKLIKLTLGASMNIELDEVVMLDVTDEVLESAANDLAAFSATLSAGCKKGYCD